MAECFSFDAAQRGEIKSIAPGLPDLAIQELEGAVIHCLNLQSGQKREFKYPPRYNQREMLKKYDGLIRTSKEFLSALQKVKFARDDFTSNLQAAFIKSGIEASLTPQEIAVEISHTIESQKSRYDSMDAVELKVREILEKCKWERSIVSKTPRAYNRAVHSYSARVWLAYYILNVLEQYGIKCTTTLNKPYTEIIRISIGATGGNVDKFSSQLQKYARDGKWLSECIKKGFVDPPHLVE